tara:strand:+ start:2183 stop:2590 length:408 start_codon:yes stop_codon:yes gene_type:complete
MYSLKEVYKQAEEDKGSANLNSLVYGARINRAIKIVKCYETDEVIILNTTLGGDYYKEITKEQYNIFKEKGWLFGIYVVSLSNYRRKLMRLEGRIKSNLINKKSAKIIQESKQRRLTILKNFSKVSNKLKELQNE